jgi:hypothetical protein
MSLTVVPPATPDEADLADALQVATEQRFRLGHLANLLKSLGDEIGRLPAERASLECQDLGLRVEYVSDLLAEHADKLGEALDTMEGRIDR